METAPLTTFRLVADTFALMRLVGVRTLLVAAILEIPYFLALMARVPWPEWAPYAYGFVTDVVVVAAAASMAADAADGGSPGFRAPLLRALARWPTLIVVCIIDFVLTVAGGLILVLPGIYAQTTFFAALPIAAVETWNPIRALGASHRRMDGHRSATFGAIFAIGVTSFLLVLGLIALETAILESLPFSSHPWRAWGLWGLLEAVLIFLATPVLNLPVHLLPAVAYLKTRGLNGMSPELAS